MNKLFLAVPVLLAFLGLSAPAVGAVVGPNCTTNNYPPSIGSYEQLSNGHGLQPSETTYKVGALCGAQIRNQPTGSAIERLWHNLTITAAEKEEFTDFTSTSFQGRYIGKATITYIGHNWLLDGVVNGNTKFGLRVETGRNTPCVKPVLPGALPGTKVLEPMARDEALIACYEGTHAILGIDFTKVWIRVTRDGSGTYRLRLSRPAPIAFGTYLATAITDFTVDICGKLGKTPIPSVPGSCGSGSDPIIHKNGASSVPNCSNGKGISKFVATLRERGGALDSRVSASYCNTWGAWSFQ